MQEIQKEQSDEQKGPLEREEAVSHPQSQSHSIAPKRSHESLWGAILFASMILFVLASVGGIGWVVYSKWKGDRVAENRPSIVALLEETSKEISGQADARASESPEKESANDTGKEASAETVAAAKKLEISVLNGGSPKGSAGVLAEALKKEGYLKTNAGSALKDYTGATVYYAATLEKEAAVVQTSVMKKYPQAKILLADKANKETSASQITIILGK